VYQEDEGPAAGVEGADPQRRTRDSTNPPALPTERSQESCVSRCVKMSRGTRAWNTRSGVRHDQACVQKEGGGGEREA